MNTRRKLLAHFFSVFSFCVSPQAIGHISAERRSVIDQNWVDPVRQRNVPVRLRWPDENRFTGPWPIVIFSHGLGGTREGGSVWGEAWVDAGFVVVHVQHTGSDLNAVRGVTRTFTDQRALRTLATPEQLMARLQDMSFVLNEIEKRHSAHQDLWHLAIPTRVGLAGHSFGAHTTMGMAGQRYPGFEGVAEPRLASFIAFSPTVPMVGSAQRAFERLSRPLLSITGTRDSDVVGVGATPEKRKAVFAALPPGDKAHLVLMDADHMTFAGQVGSAAEIVPRESITRELQAEHHARVSAITTDWWRATLQADSQARLRLQAPKYLGVGDLWQIKK
jgi:predicted dienelactone hydrolase